MPLSNAAAFSFGKSCRLQYKSAQISYSPLISSRQGFGQTEHTGVPNPLTASQPGCDGNPALSHPRAEPLVTSVKALKPCEYSHGLRKPKTGFPAARRASLRSEMMADAAGVDAL